MGEYLQEAVLPVQYDNYVFDLYGTLVDIHTEEDFPNLWEKLALFFGYTELFMNPGGIAGTICGTCQLTMSTH